MPVRHLSTKELEACFSEVSKSPQDEGVLELIVARPRQESEVSISNGLLEQCTLKVHVVLNHHVDLLLERERFAKARGC